MSEWISVKDRLPEDGDVLVFDGISIGILVFENEVFWEDDYPTHPTHWMPLPDPPRVEPLTCFFCGGTEHVDPIPGTRGRMCVKCCGIKRVQT